MNKVTTILLPASLAYGGVKLAEVLGQKGAVGLVQHVGTISQYLAV